MGGFTGFKSATVEELPGARAVMDPFHVVRLAGDALDECPGVSSKNFTIGAGVPSSLTEIITLGRTLSRIK